MKGSRKIEVDGKDVTLRFDWGAVEDFCEDTGISFSDFETAINSPKSMRILIYHMAKAGGSEIEKDELRKMSFGSMNTVSELISEAMTEGNGKAKPKK